MDETIGNKPINKVTFQTITSAMAAPVIVWGYSELTGKTMPLEVAIVLAGLLGGLVGYLTPLDTEIRKRLKKNG